MPALSCNDFYGARPVHVVYLEPLCIRPGVDDSDNGNTLRIMNDHRKALHDLVDQAPERDLPRLLDLLTHSLFAVETEGITFFPVEQGASDHESAMQTRFDQPGQQFTEETKFKDEADLQLRAFQQSIQ